jgi:hypothetical protein
MHAFHGGEGRSGDHRPESIRRRPRKVSKSHRNGAIPVLTSADDHQLGAGILVTALCATCSFIAHASGAARRG